MQNRLSWSLCLTNPTEHATRASIAAAHSRSAFHRGRGGSVEMAVPFR